MTDRRPDGPPTRLLLATHNAGKLTELRRILAPEAPGVDVAGLDDVDSYPEPRETEPTFAGNALLKARAGVQASGLPTLADDSGLCVDALNGMPGVLSARWSGRPTDDRRNLTLLLDQLVDVPDERRTAAFCCVVALAHPDGTEQTVEGRLSGRIADAPRGDGGFGYDPIFCPDDATETLAEMGPEAKDAISHRGRALRAILPELTRTLAG